MPSVPFLGQAFHGDPRWYGYRSCTWITAAHKGQANIRGKSFIRSGLAMHRAVL